MPILSRRSRRLLKLLFGISGQKWAFWVFRVLPTLLWVGVVVYAFWGDADEWKMWGWGVLLYLYMDRHNNQIEKDYDKTKKKISRLQRDIYEVNLRLQGGYGSGVKVDVNDFANKAQLFGRNQARHEAQRR